MVAELQTKPNMPVNITKDNFKLVEQTAKEINICSGCCFNDCAQIGEFHCNSTINELPTCIKHNNVDYVFKFINLKADDQQTVAV